MTLQEWQAEILRIHPTLRHFPINQWPLIALTCGYLPLPPERLEEAQSKSISNYVQMVIETLPY